MSFWYHGTSVLNAKIIINHGFKTSDGIWGEGVYLSSSIEGAFIFGDAILRVHLTETALYEIQYSLWRTQHSDENQWGEKARKLAKSALVVQYEESSEKELVIYDTSILKHILLFINCNKAVTTT